MSLFRFPTTLSRKGRRFCQWSARPLLTLTACGLLLAAGAPDVQGTALWTTPTLVNANPASDSEQDDSRFGTPVAGDGQGVWVAAWHQHGSRQVLLARSTDDGTSWSTPVVLATSQTAAGVMLAFPQVATDGQGNWLVVWTEEDGQYGNGTDRDLIYSRSTDNGLIWSVPALLNSNASTDSGVDRYPSIACDRDGTWLVTWTSNNEVEVSLQNVWYSRSTDAGATWSNAALLADDPGDRAWHVKVAPAGGDTWLASWISQDSAFNTSPTLSRSSDGGLTWSSPRILDSPPSGAEVYNFESYLAADSDGNVMFGYVRKDQPTADSTWHFYTMHSRDAGETWSSAARVDFMPIPTYAQYWNHALVAAGDGRFLLMNQSPPSPSGANWFYLTVDLGENWIGAGGHTVLANQVGHPYYATTDDSPLFPDLAWDGADTILCLMSFSGTFRDSAGNSLTPSNLGNDTDLFVSVLTLPPSFTGAEDWALYE